eukprot:Pompholyxophrys_punicea_v1_NODE_383_length_2086_cov_4.626292.p1 type:complete len:266 gc:universal NODE_383_length_2086_cov_4.626292:988-1785(+)
MRKNRQRISKSRNSILADINDPDTLIVEISQPKTTSKFMQTLNRRGSATASVSAASQAQPARDSSSLQTSSVSPRATTQRVSVLVNLSVSSTASSNSNLAFESASETRFVSSSSSSVPASQYLFALDNATTDHGTIPVSPYTSSLLAPLSTPNIALNTSLSIASALLQSPLFHTNTSHPYSPATLITRSHITNAACSPALLATSLIILIPLPTSRAATLHLSSTPFFSLNNLTPKYTYSSTSFILSPRQIHPYHLFFRSMSSLPT